jgi:hypothetical protein
MMFLNTQYIINRSFHVKRCKKGHFSSPTFFDFFENWHNQSFWQKTDIYFLASHKKTFFLNLKKITNEEQLYDVCCGDCLNFF